MTHGLKDAGEEAILRDFWEESLSTKPTEVYVGLYNDDVDRLPDSARLSDISTEPEGTAYQRVAFSFGTTDFTASDDGADWQAVLADKEIDVSDSSQNVDSYFVVMNFQSQDAGDSSANDRLIQTGPLDKEFDLSNFSIRKTLSGLGVVLN